MCRNNFLGVVKKEIQGMFHCYQASEDWLKSERFVQAENGWKMPLRDCTNFEEECKAIAGDEDGNPWGDDWELAAGEKLQSS